MSVVKRLSKQSEDGRLDFWVNYEFSQFHLKRHFYKVVILRFLYEYHLKMFLFLGSTVVRDARCFATTS